MNAKELYSSEQPVLSLVEAVCVRPEMYTLSGSLEESAAFLNGFYSGIAAHNLNTGAINEVEQWMNFCQWACQQLGSRYGGWNDVFQTLRIKCSNDNDAFVRLAILYIEYRQERETS